MSAHDQARALMMRHHHMAKNRQQSLLSRSAAEVGLPLDDLEPDNASQAKSQSNLRNSYDRSHASMS